LIFSLTAHVFRGQYTLNTNRFKQEEDTHLTRRTLLKAAI